MDEKDREIQKTREYNYILWTIIVVLAIMLVNLFAQQTCENKEFVNQVSFASTISSIILSVIAIIMTVVSSDSMNNLLHKFRDLCDTLQNSPKEIERSTASIVESSKKLEDVEIKIQALPELLRNNQDSLNEILTSIKDTILQLDRKILGIKSNTDNMTQQLSFVNDKMQGISLITPNFKPNEVLEEGELKNILFFEFSYWNICLLYALKVAYENHKEISLYDNIVNIVGEAKDSSEESYFFSFIQCLSYFRFVEFNLTDEKYKIVKLNKIFLDEIDEAFDNFIINHQDASPTINIEKDKHNIYNSIVGRKKFT